MQKQIPFLVLAQNQLVRSICCIRSRSVSLFNQRDQRDKRDAQVHVINVNRGLFSAIRIISLRKSFIRDISGIRGGLNNVITFPKRLTSAKLDPRGKMIDGTILRRLRHHRCRRWRRKSIAQTARHVQRSFFLRGIFMNPRAFSGATREQEMEKKREDIHIRARLKKSGLREIYIYAQCDFQKCPRIIPSSFATHTSCMW